MRYLVRGLVVAVCLAVLALCGATWIDSHNLGAAPHGYVDCEFGYPAGWINLEIVGKPYMPVTVAHERDHLFKVRLIGCKEFNDRIANDDEWRLQLEVEGYCAGALKGVETGFYRTPREAIWDSADRLRNPGYRWPDGGLTIGQAVALIRDECGEELRDLTLVPADGTAVDTIIH